MFIKKIVIVAFCVSAAGCATITRGTTDTLQVISEPSGAKVSTSNGYSCESTPCAIKMDRKSELVVTVSKDGCDTVRVNVTNKVADSGAAGVAGNVIFGGVIGLAVDVGTGASLDLVPNPVDVKLVCDK